MTFRRSCLVMAAVAFLMVRPDACNINIMFLWAPDDQNYVAHTTSMVYGQFPRYELEFVKSNPFNHSLGPSLLSLPFAAAFSIPDRLSGHPIIGWRTEESVSNSWTVWGIVMAAQFYMLLGLFLLDATCRRLGGRRTMWVALLSVLASGLPYYAYRRGTWSHTFEFAVGCLAIYLVAVANDRWALRRRPLYWSCVVATALLIFLVRYNNAHYAVVLCAAAAARTGVMDFRRMDRAAWIRASVMFLVLPAAFIWTYFKVISTLEVPNPNLWNTYVLKQNVFKFHGVVYYIERFFHVLFGIDWGMVFTAPLVLLGLYGAARHGEKRWISRSFAAAALVNFAMIVSWGAQGASWGYRYFVYAALPAAGLGLSQWIARDEAGEAERFWITCALSIFPIYMLLIFEGNPRVNIFHTLTQWGDGYTNHELIAQMLKVLTEPKELFRILTTDNGFLALHEIAARLGLGKPRTKYPSIVFIKCAMCWTLPIAVAGAHLLIQRQIQRAAASKAAA